MTRLIATSLLALTALACSKSSDAPAPAPPSNGAPIAFEVTKMTPGKEHDGKLDVKAYNFSDKKIAGYTIAARYTDKAGAVIKVGVGTPFEATNAWTSFSGPREACSPKSWCTFEIEMLEVPANAAKAEVALTSARAVADDGVKFEEGDVWKSKDGMGEWPSDLK
jgi:hypothetical protein